MKSTIQPYYRTQATEIASSVFRGTGTSAAVLIRNIEALAAYMQDGTIPEIKKQKSEKDEDE